MKVDHIGYAVKSIEKAREKLKSLGFLEEKVIEDEKRKVTLLFMQNENCRIELVAPSGEGSPVDGILKNTGSMPYHICYQTDNLEAEIERLRKEKYRVVKEPEEACAFDGRRVAFLCSLSVGLIELVEMERNSR